MKFTPHLTLLVSIWLLAHTQGLAGQGPSQGGGASGAARALTLGVPIERDMRSGEAHEYGLTTAAGDLISGTLELRGLAGLVQVLDPVGQVIRTNYLFPTASARPNTRGVRVACGGRVSTANQSVRSL